MAAVATVLSLTPGHAGNHKNKHKHHGKTVTTQRIGIDKNIGKLYSPSYYRTLNIRRRDNPRFDQIYYAQPHNTFEYGDDLAGWLDQGFRSVELDILDTSALDTRAGPIVSHSYSATSGTANCGGGDRLSDCLRRITTWMRRNRSKYPLVVFVDMKGGDDADSWSGERIQRLDSWIGHYLGRRLYPYSRLAAYLHASGPDMRRKLARKRWPHVSTLAGNIIVVLTGGKSGSVNQNMEDAYELIGARRLNSFLCPNIEYNNESEVEGTIDGMSDTNSGAFVCANEKMGNSGEYVLNYAAENAHIVHTWSVSGDFETTDYAYNHMAIANGAQFLGMYVESYDEDSPVPYVGYRAHVPAYFNLVDADGHCARVEDTDVSNGTDIVAGSCDDDLALWHYTAEGQIRPKTGNPYCLDIDGGKAKDGKPIHAWNCDGGDSEKWFVQPDGRLENDYDRDICLETVEEGEQLILGTCDNTDEAQVWRFRKAEWWYSEASDR